MSHESEPISIAKHFNDKDKSQRTKLNRYGVPVMAFRCRTCGQPFTICPAPAKEKLKLWENCLEIDCASYDESRDADKHFKDAPEP